MSRRKPAWAPKVLFGKRRTFGNLVGRIGGTSGINTLARMDRHTIRCLGQLARRRMGAQPLARESSF